MSDELKPCPFCGGTLLNNPGECVHCNTCSTEGPWNEDEDHAAAIAAWNRRATPPAVSAIGEAFSQGGPLRLTHTDGRVEIIAIPPASEQARDAVLEEAAQAIYRTFDCVSESVYCDDAVDAIRALKSDAAMKGKV